MHRQGTGPRAAAGLIAAATLVLSAGGCATVRQGWSALVSWARSDPPAPRAVVRPDPRIAGNRYRIGRHLQDRGRHREALHEFAAALEADPECVKCLNARGASCDALGLWEEAGRSYRAALRIAPDQAYLHNNLGYSLLLQGDRAGARAELERAVALDPGGEVARNNLRRAGELAAAPAPAPEAAPRPPEPPPRSAPPAAPAAVVPDPAPRAPAATVAAPGPSPIAAGAAPAAPNAASAVPAAAPPRVAAATSSAPPAASASPSGADVVVVPIPSPGEFPAGTVERPVRLRRVTVAELRREQLVELAGTPRAGRLREEIRAFLAGLGFRVALVEAEGAPEPAKTLILYREGALQPAYEVAKAFPGYQEMEKTDRFSSPEATVRVLLGRDMGARRSAFAVAGSP